jgi:uncharacterized protein (DUF302 family)
MAHEFKHHGVDVAEDFEYYSIMVCNPNKGYKSISSSPVRGAVLLPPKQVVVYKENGKTIMAYVVVEEDDVKSILPDDEQFQWGLAESSNKIEELVKRIL